tara:strand:- start:122 stop:838 length:717 start_codon:yes stop_codon:yes gene_type:complete
MILITRPKDQAQKLNNKLLALKTNTYIESLSKIKLQKDNFVFQKNTTYLISSPQTINFIIENISKTKNIKFLVIGTSSSAKLKDYGFRKIIFTAKNSDEMLSYLKKNSIRSVNYMTGTVRNKNFCNKIENLGIKLILTTIYKTQFKKSLSQKCIRLIKSKSIKFVLIYSPANARHFIKLLKKSNLQSEARYIIYVCLSKNIAQEFINHGFTTSYARLPNEISLINKLKKLYNREKIAN